MRIEENENGGLTITNGLEKWNIYVELVTETGCFGGSQFICDAKLTVKKEEWKEDRYYSRKSIKERADAYSSTRH